MYILVLYSCCDFTYRRGVLLQPSCQVRDRFDLFLRAFLDNIEVCFHVIFDSFPHNFVDLTKGEFRFLFLMLFLLVICSFCFCFKSFEAVWTSDRTVDVPFVALQFLLVLKLILAVTAPQRIYLLDFLCIVTLHMLPEIVRSDVA